MAENLQTIHISELEEQYTLSDNDVLPLDTPDNRTLKVKAETIKEYATDELSLSKIDRTEKGAANGVATLDSTGMVPVSQLPSFVDDVLEGTAQNVVETAASTFSADGFILKGQSTLAVLEEGKTYVDITSNIQYRWTGTGNNLVSMGVGLALGETSNTAYAGNKGKANADAIADLQSGKVDKVAGKGLSTEDYTTEEKQKLAEISVSSDYAEDSEAYAKGTRGGVPVPNTDDAYHNNSLFYSVISGSAMRIAGVSAETAIDNARKSQSYATGDAVDDQGNPYRPGQANDNAKKYCELAEEAARQAGALDMEGATATTDGAHGLVPKPNAGDQNKYLKGDGTWEEPEGATNLIANIETSSISSHAYAIGQQFVLNGVLHIATAAIAINDAFVVGTNCAINQNITDQIKAIVDAYVTGVKGNSESKYRTGDVNISYANIGTVPITNGGTNATTAQNAKANLGLGTSAQNFRVTNPTDANQPLHLRWKDSNTNSDLNGKELILAIQKLGIQLWNSTDSGNVWRIVPGDYVDKGNTQTITGQKTFNTFLIIDRSGTPATADATQAILRYKYKNPNNQVKQVDVIRAYGDSETAANNGIAIIGSSTGVTILTAGEGAPTVIKNQELSNGESIELIADTTIKFWTNAGTAANVIYCGGFSTAGKLQIAKGIAFDNATARNGTVKALFNNNSGSNVGYVLGTNSDWSNTGYVSLSTLKNSMDFNTWILKNSPTTVAWGTLSFLINTSIHLVIVNFTGNGTQAPVGDYTFSAPEGYSPSSAFTAVLRISGSRGSSSQDNYMYRSSDKIIIRIHTATTWGGGQALYFY